MILSIKKFQVKYFLPFYFLFILISCSKPTIGIWVDSVKCDYKKQPTGVGHEPTFSWELKSNERNQKQTAYQLIISQSENFDLEDENYWDSGRIVSEQSIGVKFSNLNLKAGTRYYWKVKVWDKKGIESAWSETASFITALFEEKDWNNAKWISCEEMDDSLILVPGIPTWGHNTKGKAIRRAVIPLFRKEFKTEKKIETAFLFVSGLGHYKAYINEKQISDDFMSPGWTHYQKTCLYNTYDITNTLKQGENAIGFIVGTGFHNINNERYRKLLITYGTPKLIAKIQINYQDGTSKTLVTGDDWKTCPSPITYTSIYGGETYDARLEQAGWSLSEFDDSKWQYALLSKIPKGGLVPETTYPVRILETFKPETIIQTGSDTYMIDFGQNASGIVNIKVKGNRGDTVRITPSELINDDNSANQSATGRPHYYEYILRGDGVETWQAMFTYYGMRYAQVHGAHPTELSTENDKPELLEISSLHTYNSAPHTGTFTCSNPLFNQIDTLIRYGIQSNMQSVLTDCPHREKLGWLEQSYLMGGSLQHSYELYHLYCKVVRDMMDTQRENGLIGSIAPEYVVFGDEFTDSPEWGSAIVMLPWLVYKWYGDITLMKKAWPAMLKYMNYLDSKSEDHILSYGLGDWYDLGPNPPGFSQLSPIATTATSIYFLDYVVLAKMAIELEHTEEAKLYTDKAIQIKKAYNDLLFDKETGVYSQGSQTSMAIPLSMNLVEDEYHDLVLNNLVDSIIADEKAVTAGDIGFYYLIDALTEGGKSQLIYEMNNRDDVPGYGFQIRKGATALTESWDALPGKSNNHMMLGHLEEWLYTGLGGIRQEENSVAYKNIIIKPTLVAGLKEVRTSYHTPHGLIKSEWENSAEVTVVRASIPVNCSARIFLPARSLENVSEGGSSLNNISELKVHDSAGGELIVEAGSGDYEFVILK